MNIKKTMLPVLLMLMLLPILSTLLMPKTIKAYAAEITETDMTENSVFEATEDKMDPGIPTTSPDKISGWIDRKGFEVIGLLQKFVQPFAIVIFIGCAIMTLIGAFGNSKMVSGGMLGMGISMVMYVVVLYAPEIMDVFLGWVRT